MEQAGKGSGTNVFGLYELTDDGTILYSRLREGDALRESNADAIGQDLFRDIVRCRNTEGLGRHFRRFATGDRSVDKFSFDCLYDTGIVRTKVYMTRACENDRDRGGGIVILDIRQAGQ